MSEGIKTLHNFKRILKADVIKEQEYYIIPLKKRQLHPGRLTWNVRIDPWKRKSHLPNHHFQVLC